MNEHSSTTTDSDPGSSAQPVKVILMFLLPDNRKNQVGENK